MADSPEFLSDLLFSHFPACVFANVPAADALSQQASDFLKKNTH
jgi:hypothetical protein